ncbi:MAG: response regulator [Acidobacteria bacterium]|nr:response regulator [Acidobacteriota bacterium]
MRTILWVDDSTYSADQLREFLLNHGYGVALASDARTAVELVCDRDIKAVLLDCHLPQAEDVALAIRHARPNLPIVMISGYCGIPCERLQYADTCLQKGFSPATLLEALTVLLRSKRYGLCRSVPYRAA